MQVKTPFRQQRDLFNIALNKTNLIGTEIVKYTHIKIANLSTKFLQVLRFYLIRMQMITVHAGMPHSKSVFHGSCFIESFICDDNAI